MAVLGGLGLLSAAVQAYTARRIGEGETERAAMGLKVALVMAAGLGSLVALGGWLCAEPLFARISEDPAVRLIGAEYLQVRLLVAPITVCTFAFHGFWNGVGQSRRYLMVLLILHSANALLDWLLIFGNWGAPERGHRSAVATLSQGRLCRLCGDDPPRRRPVRLPLAEVSLDAAKTIGHVALPSGLQQATFSAGFLVIFSMTARIDTGCSADSRAHQPHAAVRAALGRLRRGRGDVGGASPRRGRRAWRVGLGTRHLPHRVHCDGDHRAHPRHRRRILAGDLSR